MNKDILVKLDPFMAHSKNLMEAFLVIGYKEEILLNFAPYIIEKEKEIELSFISSIISDISFYKIENKIIDKVYPEKPNIIKVEKKGEKKPDITNVVFSFFFNSDNHKKVFYSFYALRFYEKFSFSDPNTIPKKEVEYYVPKAFLIISEYPYFTVFHEICLYLYKNNIEIKDKEKEEKKNIKKKDELYMKDNIPIEIFIHCLVNYIPSPMYNKIIIDIFGKPIHIPKLTGYPYINFNLYQVLKVISIDELIKIFLLIFLETPLIIFSENIEKLNLLLYSLYILNYPLMDTIYLLDISSISVQKMKNLPFINNIIGVYKKNDQNIEFNGVNFVFDVDQNKLIFINKDNNKESEKINNLLIYINNKKIAPFLNECITHMKQKLKEDVYKIFENIPESFFYTDGIIDEKNREIQLIFYDFILNIILKRYEKYQLDESCSSIKELKGNEYTNLSKEENFFYELLAGNGKHNFYFNHFIKIFKQFDEFRISQIFCDEFIYLKKNNLNNKEEKNINYFEIIDNLYSLNQNKPLIIDYKYIFENFKSDIEKLQLSKFKKKKKFTIILFG